MRVTVVSVWSWLVLVPSQWMGFLAVPTTKRSLGFAQGTNPKNENYSGEIPEAEDFPLGTKQKCLEQIKDLGMKYVSTLSWSTRRLSAALSSPICDHEPNTQPSCLDSFISKMHHININHHQTYNTCICNHIMHVCLFCSIVYGHMVHLLFVGFAAQFSWFYSHP